MENSGAVKLRYQLSTKFSAPESIPYEIRSLRQNVFARH